MSLSTDRYATSLSEYLSAQYIAVSTLNLLNLLQNVVISFGTLGGCILIVYDVHAGRLSVGRFLSECHSATTVSLVEM